MIWLLLVLFQLKHFVADYLLQNQYMLGKFKDKGWILPLASHCAVHFWFTCIITLGVFVFNERTPTFLPFILGALDFSIHFIMDRIKASPKLLGRYQALSKREMLQTINDETSYKIKLSELGWSVNEQSRFRWELDNIKEQRKSNVLFWWSLGLDQLVHHLTDIVIVYLIISSLN